MRYPAGMVEGVQCRLGRVLVWCGLILGVASATAQPSATNRVPAGENFPALTNLAQFRALDFQREDPACSVRLEGTVRWVNAAQRRLVLQDPSGAEVLEMAWQPQGVRPGQRVRVEGAGIVRRRGSGYSVGTIGPIVDNDGVHGMIAKSGAVFLSAGNHPLRVEWFNRVEVYGLEVEYEGPGLPRQRIPNGALAHLEQEANGGPPAFHPGLTCRCYEGDWEALPDFASGTPVKSGVSANLDLSGRVRNEHVALEFSGVIQVPRDSVYTFHLKSDDGSRLFVEGPPMNLEVVGDAAPPSPRPITIGQQLPAAALWAQIEGNVRLVRKEPYGGWELELTAGAGQMRVQVDEAPGLEVPLLQNCQVRVVGLCQGVNTVDGQTVVGLLWASGRESIERIAGPAEAVSAESGALRLLTAAGDVHQLKREEAQRGYPVRLRGVVTSVLPEHQAFTVQDAARGLYVVDASENRSAPPRIGDFLEIEGTTDPGLFAPVVNAQRVRGLGAGHLPEPVRPAWDQLMNGSLDGQYVEVQGIITTVRSNTVALLTRGGVIRTELRVLGAKPAEMGRYENALVRIRGCLFALWDYETHQVKTGEIRIYGADILVDEAAPADLFSAPTKTAAELRLFDPQAGVFRRVRVAGQIVHIGSGEYFLMDHRHGVRFVVKQPAALEIGDCVEVVGFPDLWGSASPVLREASARKTGRAVLLEARPLEAASLMRSDNDSTRVRVEGLLVSLRASGPEQVLEMQSGMRSFTARLKAREESMPSLPPGSRLELTGVYAGQGGNPTGLRDVASFELFLNAPADIQVLARPPWWTLKRLLVSLGALACLLAMFALWVTQLRRQVDQRTTELGAQIRARERVEHQRALEQERTRIAQDLHDELGSGITEVSMLAARAKSVVALDEQRNRYLEQAGDKAREMVTALDEIVWAMNPRHDSLAALVSYFSLYADRFLGLANIAWQIEGPGGSPDHVVDSHQRHQLFLAFKEALTNVVCVRLCHR